ncbi:MAG: Ig-like domain-containing protein, partial [Bacteroidota bacterium]
MKFFKFYVLSAAVSLVVSCAQQRGIKGGEKDTQPPKIISTSLDSVSTNFQGFSISMTFDEWVQIGSYSDIIFTPALKSPPQFNLKGKTVTLTWNDTLLANTTYQVDFSNAISDITKTRGIIPLLAAIPGLLAAAAPKLIVAAISIAKAAGLGAAGTAAGIGETKVVEALDKKEGKSLKRISTSKNGKR